MFKKLTIATWSILAVIISIKFYCAESTATINSLSQVSPIVQENATQAAKLQCDYPIACTNDGVQLGYNLCMTYDNESATVSVGFCPYFDLNNYDISDTVPGLIGPLPDDISELNDYICGPMNRKGILCAECIEGYGPSVTSTKFRCTDCSTAWYGVPLYLLSELGPVTIFYLIVLIFQLNLTSAPMISFILYSNVVVLSLRLNITNLDQFQFEEKILSFAYSTWTLDFFRFVLPPICVSPNLKIIHVLSLQSISAVFPFILIGVTWLCIKLHSRNYKIVTWPWQLLNKALFKHVDVNVTWNSGRTVIDSFATFFLLSYSKVTVVLLIPFYPLRVHNLPVNNTDPLVPSRDSCLAAIHSLSDPRVNFASTEQLPFFIVAALLFLFAIFPPVLLLALYPFQWFRTLLFKCLPARYIGPLNIFAEKYYSCYRDGLDGGRDMRSLASFYFFAILLSYSLWSIESAQFFLVATLFGGCSIFIAIVQPYKKKSMSVIDALILANLAFLYTTLDRNIYALSFYRIVSGIAALIPAIGLFGYTVYRVLLKKPLKRAFLLVKQKSPRVKSRIMLRACCYGHQGDHQRAQAGDLEHGNINNGTDDQLPHRVVHPQLYTYK